MAVSKAVANLIEEYKRFSSKKMIDLFNEDKDRAKKYTRKERR